MFYLVSKQMLMVFIEVVVLTVASSKLPVIVLSAAESYFYRM